MKKALIITLAVISMIVLVAPLFVTAPVKAQRTKGPRSDYADIYFYGSQDAAYAAFKSGGRRLHPMVANV